jgi:uncharacterized protein YdhG (YjbR/CyaY superfamily)
MAKNPFRTVDEYIASFPEDVGQGLEKIRQTIKQVKPEAEEVISYNIPAFKYHGWLIYFSAYKAHYAISFPPPFTVFKKFEKELAPYKVSTSAIQFPFSKPFPFELIRNMVEFRAKENLENEGTKKK